MQHGSERREEIWKQDEIDRFLAACEGERHGAAIALGFKIMLYTTQRPGDVRAMAWSAYDGDTLTIRQQKTGKLVEVHCLDVLREALDEARAKRTGTVIVAGPSGQRLAENTWRAAFDIIRHKAGLDHLQARDLRRTAVVNMYALCGVQVSLQPTGDEQLAHLHSSLHERWLADQQNSTRNDLAVELPVDLSSSVEEE